MGVLIVLGTALVIGLVIKRLYDAGGPRLKAAHAVSLRIAAPPGAVIAGVTALDGELAIWIKDGPSNKGGGKVVLVDPRTGNLSGTVTLSPK